MGVTSKIKLGQGIDFVLEIGYLIVVKDTNKQQRKHQMATQEYTVLYRNTTKFASRNADLNVYTFKTAALNEDDAFRIFKMSRLYSITTRTGRKVSHFKRFKVTRIYTGDGIHRCPCKYCVEHPSFAPAVRTLKSRMPRWMHKSFSK